jgi:hypothetical protein
MASGRPTFENKKRDMRPRLQILFTNGGVTLSIFEQPLP